jgi:hypothetical protein
MADAGRHVAVSATVTDEKCAAVLDEKQIASSESQISHTDDEGNEITWTEEEEKRLVRKYVISNCECGGKNQTIYQY